MRTIVLLLSESYLCPTHRRLYERIYNVDADERAASLQVSLCLSHYLSLHPCVSAETDHHFHISILTQCDVIRGPSLHAASSAIRWRQKAWNRERERKDNRGEGHTGALNAAGSRLRWKNVAAIKDIERHLNLQQML